MMSMSEWHSAAVFMFIGRQGARGRKWRLRLSSGSLIIRKTVFLIHKFLLTRPNKLWFTDLAVALRGHSVHSVRVELTAASVGEVTRVVQRPAFSHRAAVVLRRGHVVMGVVGGLPAEDDHVGGAFVRGPGVRRSTGD